VDESRRATSPGDEDQEEPLLLHPYHDDPEEHLEFRGEIVKPKNASKRGEKTIEVLGLNRMSLVQSRRDRLAPVDAALARISRYEKRLERANDPWLREERDLAVEELAEMLKPGKPYSMAVASALKLFDP
jgi:hypothetical protein